MKLPPIIRDDWQRKIAALVFAFIAWWLVFVHISGERTYHRVDVELQPPDTISILTQAVPQATVTVSGPAEIINALDKDKILVTPRIPKDAPVGSYEIKLSPKVVSLPRGLRTKAIHPSAIEVELDHFARRSVPVSRNTADILGKVPDFYGIRYMRVLPEKVEISGPQSYVKAVEQIVPKTRIQLDEFTPLNFQQSVALREMPHITISPRTITVSVEFYRLRTSRIFKDVELQVLGKQPGIDIEIIKHARLREVVIWGPRDVIDILKVTSVRAFVDVSLITSPGNYPLQVHVWLSAKDCEVRTQPAQVTVTATVP
jgi:YbbR domain-containing protein